MAKQSREGSKGTVDALVNSLSYRRPGVTFVASDKDGGCHRTHTSQTTLLGFHLAPIVEC